MADDSPIPDDLDTCQRMIRELLALLASERRDREKLQHRLDQLLRRLYGPRSEKRPPGPGLFDAFAPVTGEHTPTIPVTLTPPSISPPPKRRGHGRRQLPADLPRQRIEHDLSDAEKCCPCCAAPLVRIGESISERLDYVPASLFVVEHVRPKYLCRRCTDEPIVTTPLPPEPIDKGMAAPGLLAHVIVSKFVDHLPLYRQEQIFARHGLELPRATLCDWLAGCAHLLTPLVDLMCSHVRRSRVIHTDDTPVRLQHADGTRTSRIWVYQGDATQPYTVFESTLSRSRDGPQTFLRGFTGYLQADAFSGYDGLFVRGVTEVACWAHARRKFVEAEKSEPLLAAEAVARIRALYAIETRAKELSPEARAELRRSEAAPLLTAFKERLDHWRIDALPKSAFGQAVGYTLNQWKALNVYWTNGQLSIDNNAAERALRGTALGRKNWLFFGSENGGRTAAVLMSLVATCRRHSINPWAYLRDVLTQWPTCPAESRPQLLPDVWAKTQAAAS